MAGILISRSQSKYQDKTKWKYNDQRSPEKEAAQWKAIQDKYSTIMRGDTKQADQRIYVDTKTGKVQSFGSSIVNVKSSITPGSSTSLESLREATPGEVAQAQNEATPANTVPLILRVPQMQDAQSKGIPTLNYVTQENPPTTGYNPYLIVGGLLAIYFIMRNK